MSKVVGIDLGTTTSCLSFFSNGKPEVIPNQEGGRTTPSVVAYNADQTLVGEPARRQQITNPDRTVFSAKRFIGMKRNQVEAEAKRVPYTVETDTDGSAVFSIDGKKIRPEQVGAEVLGKLKKAAEDFLGEKVDKAVITVPAHFDNAQRQATKDAGEIAGFEVLRVINEPTACALAYGLDKKKDQTICVVDVGGGTTDISVLSIGDNVVEVISTSGDVHLGGDDADNRLIDFIADEFKQKEGIDLRKDKMALQRLKSEAEKIKKELSSTVEFEVNIPFVTADANGPKHLQTKITRAKFETLITDLVDRVFKCADIALSDAKKKPAEIDEVVFVGGSTRIPLIGDRAKKMFGKEPNRSVNPDEAVALGAAVQAGMLSGEQSDLLLLDVVSLSLGIETLGNVMTTLIQRNTTIPTKKSQVFSTAIDNQTSVTVAIAQGERPMFKDNQHLANFNLDGIPAARRGVPQIEVSFDIDANGIVNVSAKDVATGKNKNITVKSGLSKADVEKMVKEAEANAEADKKRVDLVTKFNNLDVLINNATTTLNENRDKLEGKIDLTALEASLVDAKRVVDEKDETAVEKTTQDLMTVATRMAEALYSAQAQAQPSGDAKPAQPEVVEVDAQAK